MLLVSGLIVSLEVLKRSEAKPDWMIQLLQEVETANQKTSAGLFVAHQPSHRIKDICFISFGPVQTSPELVPMVS